MATNSLAPGFIKVFYESSLAPHVMTFGIRAPGYNAGTGQWEVKQKNETVVYWVTGLTTLINLVKAVVPATVTFQYAELWTQADENTAPVFVDTAQLTIVGTHASAVQPASQMVWSYRTGAGGTGKLTVLDQSAASPNVRFLGPNYGHALYKAVADHLVGTTSIVVGRDGDAPITVTKVITKTNDALRKRYRMV